MKVFNSLHFPGLTRKIALNIFISVLFVGACFTVSAQKSGIRLENLVSGWSMANFGDPVSSQLGMRYIPTLHISERKEKKGAFDAEFSLNTWGNLYFSNTNYQDGDKLVSPYRMWARYSTSRFELRIGLQKINFGSANILRPMMWFDKMDFRDPLQLTDGVYALLGRYYFRNNANLWIWGIYGEDKTRGWEVSPSKKQTPEWGGRFQWPMPRGEMALTSHWRETDYENFFAELPIKPQTIFDEQKFGVDGKWDIGPGVWFEYVVKHNDKKNGILKEWETYLNLGTDYTFGLGNGLNITLEHFRYDNKSQFQKKKIHNSYSAMAVNYPLSVMGAISSMVYYNWDQKEWYRFINLERKYDLWSFYLMAFWNPERFTLYSTSQDRNAFAGKGIQLMAVLNF